MPHERRSDAGPGTALLRIHAVLEHESAGPDAGRRGRRSRPDPVPVGSQPLPGDRDRGFAEELEGFARWLKWEWRALLRALGRGEREETNRWTAPWIAPPRVTVEDGELPAIWGENEYELPAGSYLVEIAVPGPPGHLDRGTAVGLRSDATLLYELDLEASTTTTIEAHARLRTRMNEDGTALTEYSGRIRAVRGPWSDSG
ncbi:hypothetical protein L0U85_00620 [Glycomyces sp. L485]|uniref:hypothetical protein n=1 Tax=Glycomyces sp. L485 TaxID=2909235 RepID=UPI001F4A236B|nr:hypothetical protein [Glycomyces sp. L485]MCH7229372.1 hypothetical protein [Glycomyces sp. L485]